MLNCGQINCPGGDSNASDPQPKTMAVLPAFGPWKLVELFWLLIKRCSYALLVYCLCFWKPLHCYTSLKTPGQQINRPDLSCSIYSCIYTLDMFCLSVIPCNQTVSCNWPKWFRELPFFLIISTIFFRKTLHGYKSAMVHVLFWGTPFPSGIGNDNSTCQRQVW